MPKLHDEKLELNKEKIEAAALKVFVRQGYHGTSIRDIGKAAGASIGNIYNYYPTKEDIFVAVVKRYEAKMDALRMKAFFELEDVFEESGLARLAENIREIVYDNPDYWRLMYIDVIEFGNRHFAQTFRHLAKNLELRIGDRLRAATRRGKWNGAEPSLAFTAVYLQFFTYFLVETMFGGKQHLGVNDQQAIEKMAGIFMHGVWKESPKAARAAAAGRRK